MSWEPSARSHLDPHKLTQKTCKCYTQCCKSLLTWHMNVHAGVKKKVTRNPRQVRDRQAMLSQFAFISETKSSKLFPLRSTRVFCPSCLPSRHLRCHQADVPVKPNSTPDCVFSTNLSSAGTRVGTRILVLSTCSLTCARIMEHMWEHESNRTQQQCC